MKVPLLFYHLEYLTENDLVNFTKFIKSPYHNYYLKAYLDIIAIIKKNKNLVENKKHKELRDIIIKKLKSSENTTLTILYRLGEMVIKYFKLKAIESKKFESEYSLCEYLLSVGHYDIVDDKISLCRSLIDNKGYYDEDIYLKYYQINYLDYRASILQDSKIHGDDEIIKQQDLTLSASRDIFIYTLTRLTIGFINYTIQNIDSTCKNPTPYPVIISPMFEVIGKPEFRTYDKRQSAIIILYSYLFSMFGDLKNDSPYNNYKRYFYKIRDMFNKDFSKTHYNILMNYCHLRQRVFNKDIKFVKEGLNILSDYIESKMYVNDYSKFLSPILFRNFVISCNIPETKNNLDKFIRNNGANLHKTHIKDMINYGNAFYSYLDKKYGKALKLILELNHPQFMYKYDIRNLELKIYFEQNNSEALNSVLHNYPEHIKYEPMFSPNSRIKYGIMISYFKDLIKINENYRINKNISELEYLLQKIKNEKSFIMRDWFVNKIESIVETHHKTIVGKKVTIK